MSWEKSIEELRCRERLAEKMGGDEPVERQRGRGKLTVRERVAFWQTRAASMNGQDCRAGHLYRR
jgi:acetyl-CoA carboxylase carboxyltransferase component